ncbi:MAG: hypothetical protein K5644_07730 [Lachnospiraceae bacterium]|nr:hypothetical protein [Lachnospiraceae bacterium]
MNISGIRPTAGFYNHDLMAGGVNNYNTIDTKTALSESIGLEDVQAEAPAKSGSQYVKQDENSDRKLLDSYDYASAYDASKEYSMKGSESELKNLDVVRAISDMQKDRAISQYQYFVGDNNNKPATTVMEDFSL